MSFIQYELWKDCNNGCEYCFNRWIPKVRDKEYALDYAIRTLKDRNVEPGSSIGFMGGEFFGGQLSTETIKNKFYKLTEISLNKLRGDIPGRFLITAALMSKDKSDWFEFCEYLHSEKMDKNVLLCTSWDELYRFNDKTLKIWEETVNETHERFPDMRIHVEMIITEYLIQRIMDNPEFIHEFEKKWNCRVDFNIPYLPFNYELYNESKETFNKKLPLFFPKRKSFLKLITTHPESMDLTGIADHRFHSSELHYSFNDRDWLVIPERHKMETTCTNNKACNNCCGYLDSKVKIQQDINIILKSSL